MTEVQARAVLREVVRDLYAIRDRLKRVASALPPQPEHGVRLGDVEEPELRDVISCVLIDLIVPAIDDLSAAASPDEE
ncbi:MAG TPA: hypothetical protein VGG03_01525 [Thermoanaerobaculia bacterium]|jgi:hypothetical protein